MKSLLTLGIRYYDYLCCTTQTVISNNRNLYYGFLRFLIRRWNLKRAYKKKGCYCCIRGMEVVKKR